MMPRPTGILRYLFLSILILCAVYIFNSESYGIQTPDFNLPRPAGPAQPASGESSDDNTPPPTQVNPPKKGLSSWVKPWLKSKPHPIDELIFNAQNVYAELVSKETTSVSEAAQAYRKRRGRHPPPGFDKWFEFSRNLDGMVVEDFFDQIYEDLNPFWGMDPGMLRRESWDFEMTINVRDGKASSGSDWFWTKIWLNMTMSIQDLLPDIDLPLNAMDEPRIVVPFEEVSEYMKKAEQTRSLPDPKGVVQEFSKLQPVGHKDPESDPREHPWDSTTTPYWKLVHRGCDPRSKARGAELYKSFAEPPKIDMKYAKAHSPNGYVKNFTLSSDVCHQPDLQGLEGVLIRPLSTKTTKTYIPMFAGSKLSVSNEILLPAPMYWNEEVRFTGGDDHGISWNEKHKGVMWRGVATGGTNTEDNWRGFQRHRFVAMNNGTKLELVTSGKEEPENFALPEDSYDIKALKADSLGSWVSSVANVSFINLSCYHKTEGPGCNYTDHYFSPQNGLPMAKQFDWKYVPDIDGNSFSGRYLGLLRSTSLPIKATIFREWHDSRIVPWKHFVPMDNRFGDYYGILEYFLGSGGSKGHDKAAEKMATDGKKWAEKVLRKEDMRIYALRLMMEYARILDDDRENMGYVQDVLEDPDGIKQWKLWW